MTDSLSLMQRWKRTDQTKSNADATMDCIDDVGEIFRRGGSWRSGQQGRGAGGQVGGQMGGRWEGRRDRRAGGREGETGDRREEGETGGQT